MRIIADTWRSSATTVGIILVEHKGRTQVYIGAGAGENPRTDALAIANHGCRLSYREAKGFFPSLSEDSYGTEG